jgi:hypothetical protein
MSLILPLQDPSYKIPSKMSPKEVSIEGFPSLEPAIIILLNVGNISPLGKHFLCSIFYCLADTDVITNPRGHPHRIDSYAFRKYNLAITELLLKHTVGNTFWDNRDG